MKMEQESEVQQVLKLQTQIAERLDGLRFVGDADTEGNIIHHLAEAAVIGKKLAQETLPAFLSLPLDQKEKLGELVVDMQYELSELKEALGEMEPALIKLMNFLTS